VVLVDEFGMFEVKHNRWITILWANQPFMK
jgi:hypothetical protein